MSALTQYDDNIEDAGTAPDFCASELVTNDNQTVTIGIHVHNRNGFVTGDEYTALLDTGVAKFEIAFDGNGAQLERWNGSEYTPVPATEVMMTWIEDYGPALNVTRADLGNPTGFTLVLESTDGSEADRAPDAGTWGYNVSPLSLNVRKFTLGPARAGRTLTAATLVERSDWEIPLTEGRVACTAHLGARALSGRGSFANERVTCAWRLPANAAGKRMSGSVAVSYEGVKAARSFSVRVR